MPVKVKVPKSGRIKAPKLDQGPLTKIGEEMVASQKERWIESRNADGNTAKKLSKKTATIKAKFLRIKNPRRDNLMTGLMIENFKLRKAINGTIRAENTSREGRKHAQKGAKFEQMIGFAASDQVAVFKVAKEEYGKALQKAWIPVSGGAYGGK